MTIFTEVLLMEIQFKLPFAHINAYYFSYFPHTNVSFEFLDREFITSIVLTVHL